MTSVTSYVLQYNSAVKYSGFLVNVPSLVYKVDGSENLMNWAESQFPVDVRRNNPMNQFFLRVTDVQENEITENFPMSQLALDIVIILDETGMTLEDYESVKQFIFNFTNTYTINPQFTQFAMQTLSGNNVSTPSWYFYDSLNNDAISKRIENLQLVATHANASADITTAVSNVLSNVLNVSKGWRNSTTVTVIISNAKAVTRDPNEYTVQRNLKMISQTYGFSICNEYVPDFGSFVQQYFIETSPEELTTDPSNDGVYNLQMHPSVTPLNETTASLIFLIDNTNATQYQEQGELRSTSWTLSTFERNRTALHSAIENLQMSNDTGASNLDAAIGYFYAIPALFGINNYMHTPAFIIGVFSSPTISKNLTQSVLADVNLNYFTFAIQYGDNNVPFDYLPQVEFFYQQTKFFSGSDYAEDFVYSEDISAYDTTEGIAFYRFNAYIQSESMAYKNTY